MSNDTNNTYWRSLNQLAQNEEYRNFLHREFPENGSEMNDNLSRRNFLQIMGASVALAGLAACRKPVQKILPFSRQPEDLVPGIPLFYATAAPYPGYVNGLVIETNEGRPTKVEGNELHPDGGGASGIHDQASILDLYDMDRSRNVRRNGEISSWEDFISFAGEHFAERSRNIAFISEDSSSITLNRLKDEALSLFPNSTWVNYEPFGEANLLYGTELAFGNKLRPVNHYDRALVTVSLDHDFLHTSANNVESTRRFVRSRNADSTENGMGRLYVVENNFTVTGSMADHRLRIKSGDISGFLYALAASLSERISGLEAFGGYNNEFAQHSWIAVLTEELMNNRGRSVVTAGSDHEPEIHAVVAVINQALGNVNETVTYHSLPFSLPGDERRAFNELVGEIRNGSVDTVVMIGTNPSYTAPFDIGFDEALGGAETVIHLSTHIDETSRNANWHINRTHYLEQWGDGYSYSGVQSVIQPMIQPLFGGKSEIEFLAAIIYGENRSGHDIVRETWNAGTAENLNREWNKVLHDGFLEDSGFPSVNPVISSGFAETIRGTTGNGTTRDNSGSIELVFKPDPKLYDGRYANNPWLQELPDPVTKITWDNVALMSPETAEHLGFRPSGFSSKDEPVALISTESFEAEIPVWILPGHADNSITVYQGYGRNSTGRVAVGTGVNLYGFRSTTALLSRSDITVRDTGRVFTVATTQDHHSMEGRPLIREASISEYRNNPTFAPDLVNVPGIPEGENNAINLFDRPEFPDHEPQWGMAIDLNTCTGCGVCTIACQAENNIPVVGKREVKRGREMHWIRVDRYFNGDVNDPQMVQQPVPCMHCDQAPCEAVCPVAATTHSHDGLNQMTYNRCIGTRYCANNCPYKVRRFNFFNYPKEFLTTGSDPEIIQMAMNPEVSIRFRGVMEKCTYCVQRISRAKIDTKNETGNSRKPADGTVKTACQQACPSEAITFGDLTDSNSIVSRTKRNNRNYLLLEELNVRPRTSYLAKIRNPNPDMA
jgi:MoCo/4Fe-4S cofactor protein with predicted Tat translocation signal